MNTISLGGKTYNVIRMDVVRKNDQEVVQMMLTDPAPSVEKIEFTVQLKEEGVNNEEK